MEVSTLADGRVMLNHGGPTRRLLVRTAHSCKHRKLLCWTDIVCLPLSSVSLTKAQYSHTLLSKKELGLKCLLFVRFEARNY